MSKYVDEMSHEEFDDELNKAIEGIFQGQESLPSDEALKRTMALAEAEAEEESEEELNPMSVIITQLGRNILKLEELEARVKALEDRSTPP